LENEGFTDDIRIGFLVFLLSHARPINEVIHPHFLDQRSAFDTQFAGITATPFTYEDYEKTRERLVREVHSHLTDTDRSYQLQKRHSGLEFVSKVYTFLWGITLSKIHHVPEGKAQKSDIMKCMFPEKKSLLQKSVNFFIQALDLSLQVI
jgi:hypothetical protein